MDEKELLAVIEKAANEEAKELNLSDSNIKELPAEIGKLTNLEKLNLFDNKLTSLPAEIGKLTNLEELNLAKNELTTLPAEIGALKNLQRLRVNTNKLISLPIEFWELVNLVDLRIYENHLEVFSNKIGQLINLEFLYIGPNQLTNLPEELSCLKNLKELAIDRNNLDSFSPIQELHKLQVLHLFESNLVSFPVEIFQLINLNRLYLRENRLICVPQEIGRLKNLSYLELSNNQITKLPAEIGNLLNLSKLLLNTNQLSSVPAEIGELKNLTEIRLNENQLTSLPAEVGKLKNLKHLYLNYNQLISLPANIGELKNLTWLDLRNNKLTLLPDSLKQIPTLNKLLLHHNPELGIPTELLGPDPLKSLTAIEKAVEPSRILDYYFRTRWGRRPLNEAKVILVGRGEVGKTCIVNQLVYNVFKDTSKTEGIQISDWKVQAGKNEIRLNIWDFGGQEIMHATHQFFLTQRSLYLLALNGREGGEDYDAEYWLKLIESFAGDSPIIVVLNKTEQHPFELNYRGLRAKYPQICGFIKTDCKTGLGFDILRKEIAKTLGEMKSVKADFPSAWFAIKDKLSEMKENYLSFERFRKICQENKEIDSKAQEELAGFLHCLGIALNYKEDPRLRDTSVLNPRWVTQGIYLLLNAGQLADDKGILKLTDIARFLPLDEYPPEKHEFIMELMRKFRLCFAFPDGQHRYLIPELLGKEEPDLKKEFEPKNCLNFEYHYDVLPEGLLPQFIVRTHPLSHNQPRWRSGVILQWEGCKALVKADAAERHVKIRVRGDDPDGRRRLLAVIRSDFERIHSDIPTLEVKGIVPIPEYPDVPMNYDDLTGFEKDGIKEIFVRADGKTVKVSVSDLLNGVDLPDVRHKSGIEERGKQQKAFRLFYSYSHKDEALRDELETHLKLLQRQGHISSWHDRKILGGEEWDKKIDENLKNAEIILLLVSADFVASDYCYDVEMNNAMQKHENKEAVVVPVIIRDCDWHSAIFGKLQALPKDGKAVKLWPDRDSAWNDVALRIRKIIEELRNLLGENGESKE